MPGDDEVDAANTMSRKAETLAEKDSMSQRDSIQKQSNPSELREAKTLGAPSRKNIDGGTMIGFFMSDDDDMHNYARDSKYLSAVYSL